MTPSRARAIRRSAFAAVVVMAATVATPLPTTAGPATTKPAKVKPANGQPPSKTKTMQLRPRVPRVVQDPADAEGKRPTPGLHHLPGSHGGMPIVNPLHTGSRTAAPRALSAALESTVQATNPCDPATSNPIVCENSKPGTPETTWDVNGIGDPTLQGFATDISVNIGQTERFKIQSTSGTYRIEIYRLGWYQGNGARLIASFTPQVQYPQPQPACITDSNTGLIDCGNWAESASWAVPSTAVSGFYIARLVRLDNSGASHIPFIVRDDSSTSPVFLQADDSTWEAYNDYGGNSLYKCAVACPPGNPAGYKAAFKVSYNRPFTSRVADGGNNWVFTAEYPMIRFLERNGYNVSYTTDTDSARRGSLIKNHSLFISSGHDEYWSAEQRSNVEAARAAGVNLAFFSGNEIFWKTRYEASIAGTATDYRTLVSYKETHFDAPADPQDPTTWTGTWRDPRFSPPADGGRPENALTGTIYMADPPTDFALEVPSTYRNLRFWRNTSIATMPAGTTATLADNTLGYEFDVDADNGFRPAGLFDLSGQTETVDHGLLDFGNYVGQSTLTHHMTMYRAPSGALVFGAGTIQWSYGLDAEHDGVPSDEDVRMQQATVNLLADMKAQPLTLMTGLTAATASTDTTRPNIAFSTSSSTGTVASPATITGTASDSGGVPAGVEVSVDGGVSWHPATGTSSWSYTYTPTAAGTYSVRARAVDDSGNMSSTVSKSIVVSPRTCTCTLFGNTQPRIADSGDAFPYELGMHFQSTVAGQVTGVRFYKSAPNTGTHTGSLWASNGARLATGTFTNETASGWQTLTFASPVTIAANTDYVVSYHTNGHYALDYDYFFNNTAYSAPLYAMPDGVQTHNGVYAPGTGSAFPTQTSRSANYWVDVRFSGNPSQDQTAPTPVSTTPLNNSSSQPLASAPSVLFSKPFLPSSLQMSLSANGSTVPAAVTVTAGGLGAKLTPNANLSPGTTYTASVQAADAEGHTMSVPFTWTFRTGATQPPPGTCPCTIWGDLQQPTVPSAAESAEVELGVKFRAATSGYVTGVRFFKGPQNTGSHTGSLWTASGQLLATARFIDETSTGWQEVTFDPAVQVSAGTTYIASYHTPNGGYAYTLGYFSGGGTTYGPLTALSDSAAGGNGVYTYAPPGSFPSNTYSASNYWVQPVLSATPPAATPPQVEQTSPSAGALKVDTGTAVTATFNKSVQPGSIVFTVSSGGTALAGTMTYDDPTRTATFQPTSPLPLATTFTGSVRATGTNGLAMTQAYTWQFSTGQSSTCPCSLWPQTTVPRTPASADTAAYELGVRVRSDVAGYITGVEFYKGTGNTGTHTGSLWNNGGKRLATGTFTNETATGWQTLMFDGPVAINANTDYIASYHTNTGHYAFDQGWFGTAGTDAPPLHAPMSTNNKGNGVYRAGASGFPNSTYAASNYWVDALFTQTPTDRTPPAVTSTAPAAGSTTAPRGTVVTATFSEAVTASSVQMSLTSAAGPVSGTTSYDGSTTTATFTPNTVLTAGTTYTASVRAADVAGNLMSAPVTWTFTPAAVTYTLLADGTPGNVTSNDGSAIELGVRFTSDVPAMVTGMRFYKSSGNTGTHTGTLWSADGTVLATGTFTNETASGWQALTFATPVRIQAGTTYVVSYHTDAGNWSWDPHFYDNGLAVPPLRAAPPNGVYSLGASVFPTNSANNTNYWVDVTVQ